VRPGSRESHGTTRYERFRCLPHKSYESYRSHSSPTPESHLDSAREVTLRLLLLKRPVHESSFQQPKNETNDRVDEELIEVDKKSGG
jgi:hypothetical protein